MKTTWVLLLTTWFAGQSHWLSQSQAQTSVSVKRGAELEAEKRIQAALARRLDLKLAQEPLDKVATSLSRFAGINVVVDQKALRDAVIAADSPVAASLSDVTLRAALETMLRPLELTWYVRGEALLITTQSEADIKLETRLYPVDDLVKVRIDGETYSDFDALIDLMTTTVAPNSWDDVGGPGSLAPSEAAGALVCSQTREVHEQTEQLLEALRRVRGLQKIEVVRRVNTAAVSAEQPASDIQNGRQSTRLERVYVSTPQWAVPQVHKR